MPLPYYYNVKNELAPPSVRRAFLRGVRFEYEKRISDSVHDRKVQEMEFREKRAENNAVCFFSLFNSFQNKRKRESDFIFERGQNSECKRLHAEVSKEFLERSRRWSQRNSVRSEEYDAASADGLPDLINLVEIDN